MQEWSALVEPVMLACSLIDDQAVARTGRLMLQADITQPLTGTANGALVQALYETAANNDRPKSTHRSGSIYVFSYILAENHRKWARFVIELFAQARCGDVFVFAEAAAWQLHELTLLVPQVRCHHVVAVRMCVALRARV